MKPISEGNGSFRKLAVTFARVFVVAGFLLCAAKGLAQSTPVLTVAPTGTNQLLITVTNGPGGTYELWTTPVLGDTVDYPWTAAAVGTNGQTTFILTMPPFPAGFYRAVLDTNAIPLWEAADPNNPGAGILNVWIDSPANGTTLN
jgi:hypothetical protein